MDGQRETPESRLLALIQHIQYGILRVEIRNGTPVSFRTEIEGHLTKPLLPSQVQLIDEHQQTAG
jgi:hypothetical protein